MTFMYILVQRKYIRYWIYKSLIKICLPILIKFELFGNVILFQNNSKSFRVETNDNEGTELFALIAHCALPDF